MLHVSFVCTFNRARSVMAATIFSEQLARRGLSKAVRVTSAGTSAVVGGSVDDWTVQVLARHGYCVLAGHRAALLGDDHLSADLVVALGYEHVGVLQRRGVDIARIRYVEVRNPCQTADFEEAYAAIQAAMPALHAWVNKQIASTVVESTVGWRFWIWTPGDALRSPFAPSRAWWSTSTPAHGCLDPEHCPPVPGCCGWYADLKESDSVARARGYRVNLRGYASWDHLVVGKVSLTDVIPFRPPSYMRWGNAEIEWQGGHGTITQLAILDPEVRPPLAIAIRELEARYRVPVHVYLRSDAA